MISNSSWATKMVAQELFDIIISSPYRSQYVSSPQFPLTRNWWRHTGSCVNYQISKPIFWILRSILRRNRSTSIFLKSICSLSTAISSPRSVLKNTWFLKRYPSCRHKSAFLGKSVFWDHQKYAPLNGHNFVKNQYFLMRFFCLVRTMEDFRISK